MKYFAVANVILNVVKNLYLFNSLCHPGLFLDILNEVKDLNLNKLVWYEELPSSLEAIAGEKKIKGWNRWKKVELIQKINPLWNDLSLEWDSSADASE